MVADPEYVLAARAEPSSLDRVHALLEAVWTAHQDVSPADRMHFAIAVTEVAGNIVEHSSDGRALDFTLHIRVLAESLEAGFEDRGGRVDVDLGSVGLPDDLAESGRGLALTMSCVDLLEYRREGHTNHWRMVRRRTSG